MAGNSSPAGVMRAPGIAGTGFESVVVSTRGLGRESANGLFGLGPAPPPPPRGHASFTTPVPSR